MIKSIAMTRRPLIIAHRGVTRYAPENSLEAVRKAVELGLDGVEIDVRPTADGELVLFHDENAKRLTGIDRKISEMGSDELRKLFNGTLAFLPEILDLVPDNFLLDIELKGSRWKNDLIRRKLVEPIRNRNLASQVIISSFHPFPLYQTRKIAPELKIGLLLHHARMRFRLSLLAARLLGPFSIHPHFTLATPEKIAFWKNAGYEIFVWTVNDPAWFEGLEIDGIITDIPEELKGI